jgi:hypothetical protein
MSNHMLLVHMHSLQPDLCAMMTLLRTTHLSFISAFPGPIGSSFRLSCGP